MIQLVRPTPAEADALAELDRTAFPDRAAHWTGKDFADLIPPDGALLTDAARQGLVALRFAAGEGEILSIAVRPVARRNGLGTALLTTAHQTAADLGCHRLVLEVAADNLAAQGLYALNGYTQCGLRKAYYARPEGRVDALVLERHLP